MLDTLGNGFESLSQLPPTLVHMDLHENLLTELPPLGHLKRLAVLDVSYNEIRTLPSVLPPALRHLVARNNCLTALPCLPPSLRELEANFNDRHCQRSCLWGCGPFKCIPIASRLSQSSHTVGGSKNYRSARICLLSSLRYPAHWSVLERAVTYFWRSPLSPALSSISRFVGMNSRARFN